MASKLKDIARETGYSINTVSLALRGSERVKEATRETILSVAERDHYVPNNVARALVKQQTMTVGVVLTDITSPILTLVAHHIERLLANLGYVMILITTDHSLEREKRALDILQAQQVDGMLIVPAHPQNLGHIKPLQEASYPCVLLAGSSAASFNLVTMDDTLGAYKAVCHLIELGHRRIALLSGGTEKIVGYRRALADHHLTLDPALVIKPGRSDYEHGYNAALALFELESPPTALLAATDYLALGAISSCTTHQLTVPGDLAVIGFDDIEAAKYSEPSLSSVIYDAARISERAVNRLMALILLPPSQSEGIEKTVIEPELVIRRSSGSKVDN